MTMRKTLLALALCSLAGAAQAGKGCEDLKAAIDAKIQAKGVRGHSLDVVAAGDVGAGKVVGNCEGGSKRIVYSRGSGSARAAVPPQAVADKPAATPATPATPAAPATAAKPAVKPAPKPKAAPALGNY